MHLLPGSGHDSYPDEQLEIIMGDDKEEGKSKEINEPLANLLIE